MNTDPMPQFAGTEREQSQLPALALLARMGYQYLTREEALALRGGKTSPTVLEDILRRQLSEMKVNHIRHKGQTYFFAPANIRKGMQALDSIPLTEGLLTATEKTYDLLRLGKSLEQTVGGDTKSFTLRYIDWENPRNNVFHVTQEYRLLRANSNAECRLDLVLFVNGIPFVVIECKARDIPLSEAISDLRSYQSADYVPDLFRPVQILIATNTHDAKYATVGTETKYWSVWRSRDLAEETDAEIAALLSKSLPELDYNALATDFVREERQFSAVETEGRRITEQDRLLYHLCRPERLLELARGFILYDGGEKKIARHQQYDAVIKTMARITPKAPLTQPLPNPPLHKGREQNSPLPYEGGGRGVVASEENAPNPQSPIPNPSQRGGVIWHTQGSGKSLTMVMLANAIALCKQIVNPRIVLVTDRTDLDEQISKTFERCGLEVEQAKSGEHLRQLIRNPNVGVITTLIQKFEAAMNKGELADDSAQIFVLVDEAHRTQYGTLSVKMRQVFPNACYIAFTGTPLLKADKSTATKFGGIIDAYPMEEAIADHAVVPLLYERRHVPQDVDSESIDRWFERVTVGLTDAEKDDLKTKYSRPDRLLKTDRRLEETAFDIWNHFRANWQGADGFKAQVVAPDRVSAIKLHDAIRNLNSGVQTPVTCEVVISIDPDQREGNDDKEGKQVPEELIAFGKAIRAKWGSDDNYEKSIIGKFKHEATPEILIVVDKLLTGFDAPCNTVLYLTRYLSHHTLLQAIARVNRLYPDKDFGYILDYAGILGKLDQALNEYAALKGYDLEDIEKTIQPIHEALQALPQQYGDLLGLFASISNTADEEEYEEFLAPDDVRDEFYRLLSAFSKSLKIALSTETFHRDNDAKTIARYQDALKRFQKLRTAVRLRYADAVDMGKYEPQIAKLLNTYVSSDSVQVLTDKPINIFNKIEMEAALKEMKTPAAQADMIAANLQRTLIERMDEDPALCRKFSEMIAATIQAFREHLISELEYLRQARDLREEYVSQRGDDLPEVIRERDAAQAIYRLLIERKDKLFPEPDPFADTQTKATAAALAVQMEDIIRREAVVDWRSKQDVLNRMRADIDDTLFVLSKENAVLLNWGVWEEIWDAVKKIAGSRIA